MVVAPVGLERLGHEVDLEPIAACIGQNRLGPDVLARLEPLVT